MEQLRSVLAPGADSLVSAPSVAHEKVLAQLTQHCNRSFNDSGRFDPTHMRWFDR